METKIIYCDECGEYLGNAVNGIIYRFGQVAHPEEHVCQGSQSEPEEVKNDG